MLKIYGLGCGMVRDGVGGEGEGGGQVGSWGGKYGLLDLGRFCFRLRLRFCVRFFLEVECVGR